MANTDNPHGSTTAATDRFLYELESLYGEMDQMYNDTSAYYGFRCTGCEDNCCRTRFFHYTLSEYLYLHKGLDALSPEIRATIIQKARQVLQKTKEADQKGLDVRPMCPLNSNDKCILYDYRPMICRLHGIPHELHRPGKMVRSGPGCGMFERLCGHKTRIPFDRTVFYIKMADLENDLRSALRIGQKIKLSVAQMVTTRVSEFIHTQPD